MRLAAGEAGKRLSSSIAHLFYPNFYRLHLLYFILVIVVASGILYGSNTSDFRLAYIDAIFLSTSAMCNVGLAGVNLGSLTGFQQSVLFVLMLMGDLSIVTISVVIVRRYYFSKEIRKLLSESRTGRRIAEDIEQRQLAKKNRSESRRSKQSKANHPGRPSSSPRPRHLSAHQRGYGAFPAPWNSSHVRRFFSRYTKKMEVFAREHHYLSFEPKLDYKVDRCPLLLSRSDAHHMQGRFIALEPEQEDELGGVEYRALKVLSWVLVTYIAFWLFLVLVVMTPYAAHTNAAHTIRTVQPGNLHPVWWSVFVTISAYSNTGLTPINKSMMRKYQAKLSPGHG